MISRPAERLVARRQRLIVTVVHAKHAADVRRRYHLIVESLPRDGWD
jgi:hypothetical protein